MQPFVVSARKYRPAAFDQVMGQPAVVESLRNALSLNQVAHAYLFCGPRGVGKTTCARILAKAVNCTDRLPSGDPCGQCPSCQRFAEGRSMNVFELDAASHNGVDDIRQLVEQVRYPPSTGTRSVYIIDEVHMLSQAAFNAFLKTLEEPPAHALFILATTERHKILPTILSRCQRLDFRRVRVADIVANLNHILAQEGFTAEERALVLIAQKADGGMRDALSLFDQLINLAQGNLTYDLAKANLHVLDQAFYTRLVDHALAQDHAALLGALNEALNAGFDPQHVLQGLLEHLRNLTVVQTAGGGDLLELAGEDQQALEAQAKLADPGWVLNAFQVAGELELKHRQTAHPRLQVELLLLRLAHLADALLLAEAATNGQPLPEKKN